MRGSEAVMLALLAALAFLIGWVVSITAGHLHADTWQFWFEVGLVLWAAHFGYSVRSRSMRE